MHGIYSLFYKWKIITNNYHFHLNKLDSIRCSLLVLNTLMHYSNYAPSLTCERFWHFQSGYSTYAYCNSMPQIQSHTFKMQQQWLFSIQCMSSEYALLVALPDQLSYCRVCTSFSNRSCQAYNRCHASLRKIFLWYQPTARLIFEWLAHEKTKLSLTETAFYSFSI